VRNKDQIPKAFQRDEPGTDVYALGYQADADWRDQLVYSVLDNFWPAVHHGDLTVTVADVTVSKRTLPALLQQYGKNHKEFDAHLYHRAYTDPATVETVATLPTLGKVTVRLLTGDADMPNRVAMVRGTGMVIYPRRGRSRVPYCGVFECRNEVGNQRLRTMEPPQHDNWDPDRPEKGANRKTKKELDDHIIACIRELAPVGTEKTLTIPDLSQYLPDDGDSPEDGFDGPQAVGTGKHESFDRTPKTQTIPGQHMGRKSPTQPGGASAGDGEIEGGGDEAGGDEGGGPNDDTGGTKGSEGGGGDDSGTPDGDQGRTPVAVRSRAFLRDAAEGVYALTVHPPRPRPTGEVYLSVAAVGDDSLPTPVRVKAARLANKHKLDIPQLGRVGPVSFPKSGPLRVEVTLAEPRRLALDITAYEVPADAAE